MGRNDIFKDIIAGINIQSEINKSQKDGVRRVGGGRMGGGGGIIIHKKMKETSEKIDK